MTRLALSALLATLALFGAAPQALAHTDLVSSDPADGASVPQRPTRLTLTFSDPVPAESATVTVTGPDGSAWPLGAIVASGPTLTVELRETGSPAGAHTVAWTVESPDGDFVDGTFAFTLTAPAAPPVTQNPAATPPPTPPAVTSADGAPTSTTNPGSVATITAADTGTSTSTATVEVDDGLPLWAWVLIVAGLSVVAVVVVVGLSRRGARAREAGDGDKPAE